MGDEENKEEKRLKDYTATVDAELPRIIQLRDSNLQGALDQLLALEKKTRLAADVDSTKRLADAILESCLQAKKWKLLNDHIALLCKRRAQLTKVIAHVVRRSCEWVEQTPDDETKRSLIETIRSVSAGKLVVELERARVTRTLAQMEEAKGDVAKAGEVLGEIQVETVGSMEIPEKADFLLEQLRLMLAVKDFVRAEIVFKKINTKVLQKDDMQALKLKFNTLMIEFHSHSNDYLAMCQRFLAMYNTPMVQAEKEKLSEALRKAIMFLVLASFDHDVSELLHRLKTDKNTEDIPSCKAVLDLLTTDELIPWPLPFHEEWMADPVFNGDKGTERRDGLHQRIIQHNIRTISKYYNRISASRLAQLLGLSEKESERELSELVCSKQLYARIDRPAGVVSFAKPETANSMLNSWASDVAELLQLVEGTCHLINKENMMHKV